LEDAYLVAKASDTIEMKASSKDTPESPTIIKGFSSHLVPRKKHVDDLVQQFYGCFEQDTNLFPNRAANNGGGFLAKMKPRASIKKMAQTISRK
jgi:hypothetical protein